MREAFFKHLDECPMCNGNPFNLCPLGKVLIQAAAAGLPGIDPEQWIPTGAKPAGRE